ncbi:MAG: hypothetical protein WC977_14070 [Anaerovoracaceae bacterium]|jgi:hypothetical protein
MAQTSTPPGSAYAWWNLNRTQKRVLQQKRLGAEFGGEGAAGIGKAPYFWSQEYGNENAAIKAQFFALRSWEAFKRNRAARIIDDTVRELLGG